MRGAATMTTRIRAFPPVLFLLALVTSCQMTSRTVKPEPLDAEGEVWVYLDALPAQAQRLQFSLESLAAVRADGQEHPITLSFADLSGKEDQRQRLLATGRLPPGEYAGLSVRVKKATLEAEEGPPTSLLVPADPVRVVVTFAVARARARVVSLSLDYGRSLDKGFGFRPVLAGSVPAMSLVELLGFVTNTDSDAVTVFDKNTRKVVAVLPAGRDPRGIAVDRRRLRVFVALSGADEVASYDLLTGEEVGRARLQPGDRPHEVALSVDGKVLVTTNAGSDSASFVDPSGLVEVGRARTGIRPTALLMDRFGRRAYAFNQGSNNITVLDVAGRAASGTITTDGPPARGALNRAGDRLYVVSPISSYMTVHAVPGNAQVNRVFVGFGAAAVLLDARTDYVYVSAGDVGELQIFAPATPLPVARVELPGPATWLAIDDTYDVLLGVVPSRRGLSAMQLNSRKVLPLLDLGHGPYAAAVVGERR
jgi:YVTN family beta-propeller protein